MWVTRSESGEGSKEEKGSYTKSLNLPREYAKGHEQNIGRNMDGKDRSDKVSDENEKHVLETIGKSF